MAGTRNNRPHRRPTVAVIQPEARVGVEWDEYIGRLESPETVEVRARVSGYLDQVHFKEAKEVEKGDLPFTIDPSGLYVPERTETVRRHVALMGNQARHEHQGSRRAFQAER